MHRTRGPRRLTTAVCSTIIAALVLVACTPSTSVVDPGSVGRAAPVFDGVTVTSDVPYPAGDGGTQRLDVCWPPSASADGGPGRAVVLVHGGSWRKGDKANTWWRSNCEWLASEGFVVFNVNYRLAPKHPFPNGLDDVKAAVEWLRAPEQVSAYGYDPALIGAVGGSAGGNLVSLLATEGSGPLDVGSRVAAVAELSGPTDLTQHGLSLGALPLGFDRVQLEYLGCSDYADCPAAAAASPQSHVDASDPPFFIGHSLDEFIPVGHAHSLADALRAAGVPVTLVEVPGITHSIGLLGTSAPTELGDELVKFLRTALA